nr:MAG TPA: hypothetical protein [Caudoviricetes sp.]
MPEADPASGSFSEHPRRGGEFSHFVGVLFCIMGA